MGPYTFYDYLTFILPGGTLLFTAVYAWFGWPWSEPGATALVGLLAATFVIGNAISGVATWVEPVFIGQWPGSKPDGLWGQFASGDRYGGRQNEIAATLKKRYGQDDLTTNYRLAQTELRTTSVDDLTRLNSQIGFYRGMAIACLGSLVLELALYVWWHTHLPVVLWSIIFAVAALLFIYRYRRFWRWYGDYVIRGVMNLERSS